MIRFGTVSIDCKNKIIRNGERLHQFRSCRRHATQKHVSFAIVKHLLLTTSMSYNELFDAVYGSWSDGGPLNQGVLYVLINKLQPILQKLDLELHSAKVAGYKRYRLSARSTRKEARDEHYHA